MANVDIKDNRIVLARKNLLDNPSFSIRSAGWTTYSSLYDKAQYDVDVYTDDGVGPVTNDFTSPLGTVWQAENIDVNGQANIDLFAENGSCLEVTSSDIDTEVLEATTEGIASNTYRITVRAKVASTAGTAYIKVVVGSKIITKALPKTGTYQTLDFDLFNINTGDLINVYGQAITSGAPSLIAYDTLEINPVGKVSMYIPSVKSQHIYSSQVDGPFVAGEHFAASCYVRQRGTVSGHVILPAQITVAFFNADRVVTSSFTNVTTGVSNDMSWDRLEVSEAITQAEANAAYMKVLIIVGIGDYWLDMAQLERSDGATDYADIYHLTGTYTTCPISTAGFDDFGILDWDEIVPNNTSIVVQTATSVDGINFSPYSNYLRTPGGQIESTISEYLKMKVMLASTDGFNTPAISNIVPYVVSSMANNSCTLKIESPSAEDVTITSGKLSVNPRTEYTMGVIFKTLLDTGTIGIAVDEYDAGDVLVLHTDAVPDGIGGESDWTEYSYTFTTNPNTTYVKFTIEYSGGSGIAWVDRVCCYEGSELQFYWGDGWIDWYVSRDGGSNWYPVTEIVNQEESYFVFPEVAGVTNNEVKFKMEFNRTIPGNINNSVTPFLHSFTAHLHYN